MNAPLYIPLACEQGDLDRLLVKPSLGAMIFDARLFCVRDAKRGTACLVFGPDGSCAQGMAATYLNKTDPLPCGIVRDRQELKAEPLTLSLHEELSKSRFFPSLCLSRLVRDRGTAFTNLFATIDRRDALLAFIANEVRADRGFFIGPTLLNRCRTRADGIKIYAGPLPPKNPLPTKAPKRTALQQRRAKRGRPPLPGSAPTRS